jgi:hypothetical protein
MRKGPFLVLTNQGIGFVKEWYKKTGRIPSEVSKLYQLLLRVAMLGGAMTVTSVKRARYASNTIEIALAKRLLILKQTPEIPIEVIRQIEELIGSAPKDIYM